MARAKDFNGSNKVLKGPEGSDVVDLHVYNNDRESISCWVLSDAEREKVARTGEVWLCVMAGSTQPPVVISGFPLMTLVDENGQPKPGYTSKIREE
jgi:hypothetical protein